MYFNKWFWIFHQALDMFTLKEFFLSLFSSVWEYHSFSIVFSQVNMDKFLHENTFVQYYRNIQTGKTTAIRRIAVRETARLSASWGPNWGPPWNHHSTIVLRGLSGALNWCSIMPRDVTFPSQEKCHQRTHASYMGL